jgi:hypothetical protein
MIALVLIDPSSQSTNDLDVIYSIFISVRQFYPESPLIRHAEFWDGETPFDKTSMLIQLSISLIINLERLDHPPTRIDAHGRTRHQYSDVLADYEHPRPLGSHLVAGQGQTMGCGSQSVSEVVYVTSDLV